MGPATAGRLRTYWENSISIVRVRLTNEVSRGEISYHEWNHRARQVYGVADLVELVQEARGFEGGEGEQSLGGDACA